MATFKCTWLFDGIQTNPGTTSPSTVGWSETWYGDFGSVELAVQEMRQLGPNSWLRRRLGFMPEGYICRWVRASDVSNPRLTKLAGMQGNVGGEINRLTIPPAFAVAAQINCAALVDFVVMPTAPGDRTHHRRALIRGLPVSMINQNIFQENSGAFAAMLAFCNYIGIGRAPQVGPGLVPGIWKVRFQNPNQIFQPITAFALGVGSPKTIVISSPLPACIKGDKIAIRGVTFPRGANRIWTVLENAAAGGPYKLGKSRFDLSGAWSTLGEANKVVPAFAAPSQYVVIGLRNKKIGPGFSRTRGRRRAG